MVNEISPPNPPRLTPELLIQNDFEQKILAGKANVPISSRSLLRAKAQIRELEAIPADDLSPKQKEYLVNAYSQAGEFRKAHALSGDDVFLAIANATKKECDCPTVKTVVMIKNRPREVDHKRTVKLRNIIRDGKTIPLMRCDACGHLSTK